VERHTISPLRGGPLAQTLTVFHVPEDSPCVIEGEDQRALCVESEVPQSGEVHVAIRSCEWPAGVGRRRGLRNLQTPVPKKKIPASAGRREKKKEPCRN
jgi:hypothetical protein